MFSNLFSKMYIFKDIYTKGAFISEQVHMIGLNDSRFIYKTTHEEKMTYFQIVGLIKSSQDKTLEQFSFFK